MKLFIKSSRALFLVCTLAVTASINVAAQTDTREQVRDHRTKSTDENVTVRDHRKSETPVLLSTNRKLLLTNGNTVERLADGTVNVIEMNGRVVRSFPQGKVVKDERGAVTIISGKQRMQAGVFKSMATIRDHRKTETELGLRSSERLILTNGNYVEQQADGTVNIIQMNGRVVRSFPQGKIVNDGRRIFVISGKQRVEAGTYKSIEEKMINRRDHRKSETPVVLSFNRKLLLTNGNTVERLVNGTVNVVGMNGRVVRSFPQGKVVKNESGAVTIISGKNRVQAGVFKSIEAKLARRDHRSGSADENVTVRDHRKSETQISLKTNERLTLTNGNYIERTVDGTVNILGMNGRVVRPFPQGKIVMDKSGGIAIISGKQRVQAGVLKRPATRLSPKNMRDVIDGTSNTISLNERAGDQIIAPNNRNAITQDHRTETTGDRERVRDHRTKNVYAVVQKGRPGSTQREAYCSSKLDSCVDDVDDACSAGQESHTAEQLCRASEITTCKNAYGSTSDCLTRDLSGRQSHEIERIGGNEKVGATPERDTRPTTKNLREKVLMKGPARVKNTPVTAKDCTSFGGKLQRDDSCGSSQSCITDNYKHCVTKSTK